MLCTIATTHRDQAMTAGATVSFFRPTRDLWVAQPSGQFIIERAVPLSGAEAAPYVARASNISAMFQQVKLSSSRSSSFGRRHTLKRNVSFQKPPLLVYTNEYLNMYENNTTQSSVIMVLLVIAAVVVVCAVVLMCVAALRLVASGLRLKGNKAAPPGPARHNARPHILQRQQQRKQ